MPMDAPSSPTLDYLHVANTAWSELRIPYSAHARCNAAIRWWEPGCDLLRRFFYMRHVTYCTPTWKEDVPVAEIVYGNSICPSRSWGLSTEGSARGNSWHEML